MTLSELESKFTLPINLPGHEAFALLGLNRPQPKKKDLALARKAAVSIIFTLIGNTPKILFIKRANYKGVHSSQMAFPGGKLEIDDASLLQCAIRETNEEIGLDLNPHYLRKELSPIYIEPSNFLVQPFLFFLPSLAINELILQASEVQSVHFLDAKVLLQPQPFEPKEIQLAMGKISTKGIFLDNEFIWGASAAMLAELHYILTQN